MENRVYRNVFAEIGKSEGEIEERLEQIRQEFFYGPDKVYFPVGEDMGYLEDTGNHDVRTEGMSYGMMMCVQLNMKEEFDRIWKWAKTYMFIEEGFSEGYFAWSCKVDGTKNAFGPAPDGEEYFAMALFFASHRWGDGEGIFEYSREAKEILRAAIHKGENGREGWPMWNPVNKQILFVPGFDFTDPSYHLPHFYELFAKWSYEEDREFWKEAAKVSRSYLAAACHPVSGMNAEYAEFDGKPMRRVLPKIQGIHDRFYSDAYRTVANIGLDYEWNHVDVGQRKAAERLQYTLGIVNRENPFVVYEQDGTPIDQKALHPLAILVTTAQASLAVDGPVSSEQKDPAKTLAAEWVERFWEEPLRTGDRRYYDNCLYLFAFLALSGHYRIY
ncbi:MAG: xylanase [Lachnospiraceae bacterium]|nr:xylanase [Lachnospiraceae bacterium]